MEPKPIVELHTFLMNSYNTDIYIYIFFSNYYNNLQSVHFDLTITPVVEKSGMMLSVVKVMPHAIAVTCYARKTNKTKQKLSFGFNSAKSVRKFIDLLIYSFYSDSTSYCDPRFFGYSLFLMRSFLLRILTHGHLKHVLWQTLICLKKVSIFSSIKTLSF